MFDESSSFYGSFGRYSNGGALYERSIYLELFNGKETFRRDLTKKKTRIVNPRLNICLLGHPQFFVKAMREEQSNRDDGLMQRFLSCCPKPNFYSANEIDDAQSSPRKISMTLLMYSVQFFHSQKLMSDVVIENNTDQKAAIKYFFNQQSKEYYNSIYSEYRNVSALLNNEDVFIRYDLPYTFIKYLKKLFFYLTVSAMYGKAIIHLIRISAIINCIENAFLTISDLDIENKLVLSEEIDEKLKLAYEKIDSNNFCITVENLRAAKELVEYFILNRLVLAGYSCNMDKESIQDNIQSILKRFNEINETEGEKVNTKLAKKILLIPGEEVECLNLVNEKKGLLFLVVAK